MAVIGLFFVRERKPRTETAPFAMFKKKWKTAGETAVFHAILISCGNNTA